MSMANMKTILLGTAALAQVVSADSGPGVLHITTMKMFEEKVSTSGRGSFVKFFAPWCGHCKALRPAWDALAQEFEAYPNVQVADVDCTSSQPVCDKFSVTGYPTIKYFNKETGEQGADYQQGRDLKTLKKFVENTLMVKCSPTDKSRCTVKETAFLTKFEGKSDAEKEKEFARLEKLLAGSMAKDKRVWVVARRDMLAQMLKKTDKEDASEDDLDEDSDL
ncbi:unnamed protein product [Amoebophrya sp. A25]|nr:unnamed protein product [Amoebophrya sp. A25]|eukprot:GSA25T00007844001.1